MNKQITVRNMTNDDIDFVISSVHGVHNASQQTSEIIDLKKRLSTDILSDQPKAYVIVAEINGRPIGMTMYSTVYFADEGQIMWQSQLFVAPEFRGQGVAEKLMHHLIGVCKNKGYYAICGGVAKSNQTMHKFLDRVGDVKVLNDFEVWLHKVEK